MLVLDLNVTMAPLSTWDGSLIFTQWVYIQAIPLWPLEHSTAWNRMLDESTGMWLLQSKHLLVLLVWIFCSILHWQFFSLAVSCLLMPGSFHVLLSSCSIFCGWSLITVSVWCNHLTWGVEKFLDGKDRTELLQLHATCLTLKWWSWRTSSVILAHTLYTPWIPCACLKMTVNVKAKLQC